MQRCPAATVSAQSTARPALVHAHSQITTLKQQQQQQQPHPSPIYAPSQRFALGATLTPPFVLRFVIHHAARATVAAAAARAPQGSACEPRACHRARRCWPPVFRHCGAHGEQDCDRGTSRHTVTVTASAASAALARGAAAAATDSRATAARHVRGAFRQRTLVAGHGYFDDGELVADTADTCCAGGATTAAGLSRSGGVAIGRGRTPYDVEQPRRERRGTSSSACSDSVSAAQPAACGTRGRID